MLGIKQDKREISKNDMKNNKNLIWKCNHKYNVPAIISLLFQVICHSHLSINYSILSINYSLFEY